MQKLISDGSIQDKSISVMEWATSWSQPFGMISLTITVLSFGEFECHKNYFIFFLIAMYYIIFIILFSSWCQLLRISKRMKWMKMGKWKTNFQLLNLHRQRSFPLVAICQFDINLQFRITLSWTPSWDWHGKYKCQSNFA